MASTYKEKLLDPRWQRKRLEILNRDEWKCRSCGNEKATLHVHHIRYFNHWEPWEYPDCYLKTLCCHCHEWERAEEVKGASFEISAGLEQHFNHSERMELNIRLALGDQRVINGIKNLINGKEND